MASLPLSAQDVQGGEAQFRGLSTEALADVWYALAGAEIRHPGCFAGLLETAHDTLFARLGNGLAAFVEERFRPLRAIDAPEDALANARATSEGSCDTDDAPRRR